MARSNSSEQAPAEETPEAKPDEPTETPETEGDEPEATEATDDTTAPTTGAVIVERVGSVDQAVQDADAKRRNAELTDAGVITDAGYIGSDASDLRG